MTPDAKEKRARKRAYIRMIADRIVCGYSVATYGQEEIAAARKLAKIPIPDTIWQAETHHQKIWAQMPAAKSTIRRKT